MIYIKRYIKSFLIINILFVITLSFCVSSFAISEGTKKVKFVKDCGYYLTYQGANKLAHYAVFEENGKQYPTYCLNPENNGVGSDGLLEYDVTVTEKLSNEKIWKILINGYPYKSLEELGVEDETEAYTATQFAVYTVLHNRNPEDYSPFDNDAAKRTYQAYLKIVNGAKASTESLIENVEINIVPEKENWEVELEDSNYLSKTYSLSSNVKNGTFKINILDELPESFKIVDEKGNERSEFELNEKFKLLVLLDEIEDKLEFEINAKAVLKTMPIAYGKTSIEGTQNYALTGYILEDAETTYKDEIINNPIEEEPEIELEPDNPEVELEPEKEPIDEPVNEPVIETIKKLPVTGY